MARPYERSPNGLRLAFHGINLVNPPDALQVGKYPYGQNVRAYLRERTTGRTTLDSSAITLPNTPHSIRRLNDTTPAGPAGGFILVEGASNALYANAIQVDSGLSGNPISLLPFRPNASVQPWMYVGDSVKMDKVRSDGTCYKMGIMEPQVAPSVSFVPASDVVSLLGAVTAYIFNNPSQSHSSPLAGVYIWKNAADPVGGSAVVETTGEANDVATGNSLLFDYDSGGSPDIDGNPDTYVNWTQYTNYVGTVSTAGTAVTWNSGNQFGGLASGDKVVISGITYTITGTVTNTTFSITASAGNQTAVNYSAAAITGTVPLFVPALESQGYQDFNAAILATLYIPAAGTHTLSLTCKDDILWGIGNSANGTASWAGPTGGETLSTIGQTMTTISGYPLMPRTQESSGEDSNWSTASVPVTFSAPGNYPIELDWDYWYHLPRGLAVMCDGAPIPPIPTTTITDAQYRYTYRSSATGATSNPSPESPEAALSVLANNLVAIPSTDHQVDKIDFYRLDSGLENFTYVGTINNAIGNAVSESAVTVTGVPSTIAVSSIGGFAVGQAAEIDSGANQEIVTITAISPGFIFHFHFVPPNITATFTKTHAIGVELVALGQIFNDTLLDTDVAANPILEFDNYEPFPSIDLPRQGTVNVDTTGDVTWSSGDRFNVRWLPGTVILIGTVAYTLDTRPSSSVTLTATNVVSEGGVETVVVPPAGINLTYEIAEPILAAQPLPYLWGPTDNVSYFFGVGDPLRPGTLYWSKGNNPDSAPDTNQQDVTSPSEPLQNGCIVNGYGWVASTERAWLIVPNFFNALATAQGVSGSTWTLQLSSLTRGLYIPRCLAVDGGGNVFFRAKDGIYISPGGQGGKSITDDDLYNLFPHEGFYPAPVTRGGFTVYPPDDTQPQAQKMNVANGYLYYDYLDVNSIPRTLVYDIAAKGWVVDVYIPNVAVHVLEEGAGVNGTLCGCVDGTIRLLASGGQEAATSVLLMPCDNAGDTRSEKHWGDLWIEAEITPPTAPPAPHVDPPEPPPPSPYDMLAWMLMSPTLAAANHFASTGIDGVTPSNHLYTQLGTNNYYWIKGDSGYPWDINIFDDDFIYLSTTELTYASPTEGKRFESLNPAIGFKGVPFAKRFMNVGDQVFSTDTRFGIYTACGVATYTNLGTVRCTLAGPFTETIPGAGSNIPANLTTIHIQYEWGLDGSYNHQAGSTMETYTFCQPYGLVHWQTQNWNVTTESYDPPNNATNLNILTPGAGPPFDDPCGFGVEG